MAEYINEESYNEVIHALHFFAATLQEGSISMQDKANECVENCDNDEASQKSQEQISQYTSAFQSAAEFAEKVADAMAKELEAAREAAARASGI